MHAELRLVAGVGLHAGRLLTRLAFAGTLTMTAACAATSSIVRDRPAVGPTPIATCPVFVMWPMTAPAAFQGNVGVRTWDVESIFANRIVEVVREQCPNSEIVPPAPQSPFAGIPEYVAALGGTGVTAFEQRAAAAARDRGAAFLVVPTIRRWNQRRTDDPIGAFVPPHNSIDVSVRLVRVQSPALAGRVTFANRSRVTLNQGAARLLDDSFRAALRELLWDGAPSVNRGIRDGP